MVDVGHTYQAVTQLAGVGQWRVGPICGVEAVRDFEAGEAGTLATSLAASFARALGRASSSVGLGSLAFALALAVGNGLLVARDKRGCKPGDEAVELFRAAEAVGSELLREVGLSSRKFVSQIVGFRHVGL